MLLPLAAFYLIAVGVNCRSDFTREIQSPRITDWGSWRANDFCPEGQFVIGMRLRSEADQKKGDDSALNAVKLICAEFGKDYGSGSYAVSFEGLWGSWGQEFLCEKGSVAVGFQLRSEETEDDLDDTAANNLRLICSNNPRSYIEGDGHGWGYWTEKQMCPEGSIICGLQVQFESFCGKCDDTALNNVDMKCCKVPNIIDKCEPTDSLETTWTWDNTQSSTAITRKAKIVTGRYGHSTLSKALNIVNQVTNTNHFEASATIGSEVLGLQLQTKFATTLQYSRTTGYNWATTDTSGFTEDQTIETEIIIPAGKKKKLQQVVGSCMGLQFRSKYFITIEE